MAVFTSEDYCTNSNGYEGLYNHDKGTGQLIINNQLLNSDLVARSRARSELLKGGYVKRLITITTIFIPNLKQNDIISHNGVLWIIKEIGLSFTAPKLLMTLKGQRYE